MRRTLPANCFPSLEIEPTNSTNEWATTRAQRPRYSFQCTLTVINDNENYGVEYPTTIVTILSEIITDPLNLQMRVLNETKWSVNGGLYDTYILDSLIEGITYNASKDGSIRVAEFDWFALIHEAYPPSHFLYGSSDYPTPVRPRDVSIS